MRVLWGRLVFAACASLALAAAGGCSMGRTSVRQTYFLAVPSGKNFNYYRIRVDAQTRLGETGFRAGWFPTDAVDSLYGDTSKTGVTEAYRIQEDLKAKYNAAIVHTTEGYLNVAKDPNADPAVIQSWLVAQRRVSAVAGSETPLPAGAVEMEYNPSRSLVLRRADEKLVMVLASDPNAVVSAISSFSKDVQTSATVMRLADVLRQQTVSDIERQEAQNAARGKLDATLVHGIDQLLEALAGNPGRDQLTREIETLQLLLENAR